MGFQRGPILDFIGRGITFPFKVIGGRVELETGYDLLKASIIDILTWPKGTRYFLKQYGSEIDTLLEEPNDEALNIIIDHYVRESIGIWERRVEIIEVNIVKPKPYSLHLSIRAKVKNTKDEFSFVFPFYDKIIY